jgi:hypothetical protein
MGKKQSPAKRMVQKGVRKFDLPETKNGPGGNQKLPPVKIEPNPVVPGPTKLPTKPSKK